MIQRIIEMVLNGEVNVDQLLVVTFTTNAAAQMKQKLKDELTNNIENLRVAEQIEKVDMSNISTIHSFCSDVLKTYFYVCGIDPSFGILDPGIVESVKAKVLDDVLKNYCQSNDADFDVVSQIFHSKRSDSQLKKVIFNLYEFACCQADFNLWYKQVRSNFLDQSLQNIFVKILNEDLTETLNNYSNVFEEYARYSHKAGNAYMAQYCQMLADTYKLSNVNPYQSNLDNIKNLQIERFNNKNAEYQKGMAVPEEEYNDFLCRYAKLRKKISEEISYYKNMFGDADLTTLLAENKECLTILDKLVEIVNAFEEKYAIIKKERAALDFNDLEHYTLLVLNDETVNKELKEKFKMIFVDEYQDVNGVQEAIISKLSNNNNLFMVGDVKQSIYGFRQCDPEIFVQKNEDFINRQDVCEVILLNDNFRSDSNILQFVNAIFNKNMTKQFGKVDYVNDAQLSGTLTVKSSKPKVSLNTVVSTKVDEKVTGMYDITKSSVQTDLINAEAMVIVNKIREYVGSVIDVNGEKKVICYGDIAILMQDMKDKSRLIFDTLVANNIPVTATFSGEIKTKECLDLINFLRVIDNPYNEIYLCGTALSYFGGFTQNDLAKIKISTESNCGFFERMKEYVGSHNDDIAVKIDKLLQLIEKYKTFSYSLTVDSLLQKLIMETNYTLFVLGLPNGEIRLSKVSAMLHSIKDKSYSQSVVKYLQFLDESGDISFGGLSGGNVVKMTTIHKSKGLEYPIVISANLSKPLNKTGAKSPVINDKKTGLSIKYYDLESKTVKNSLSYCATDVVIRKREKEEKARVLYVLLTRAKYQLCLVSSSINPIKTELIGSQSANSFADWINTANDCEVVENNIIDADKIEIVEQAKTNSILPPQNIDKEEVEKRLNFVYPNSLAIDTPFKVVSSQISDDIEQDYEAEINVTQQVLFDIKDKAVFVGTAYHKLLENVSLHATKEQIQEKLAELIQLNLIDKENAERINVDLIVEVLKNQDFLNLLTDAEVYHEIPFMLKTNYNNLFIGSENSNKVVLQGILDMLVIRGETATVIDFKYTKHVDLIKRNYTPQIRSYALAVKEIMKFDKVDGYIMSIIDNKLIKIV